MTQGRGADFVDRVLDRLADLMGPTAGRAAFEFAGHAEGERAARAAGPGGLVSAFETLDQLVGQETVIARREPGVRLEVSNSPLLGPDQPLREALLLGAIEGATQVVLGGTTTAVIVERHDGGAIIEVDHV